MAKKAVQARGRPAETTLVEGPERWLPCTEEVVKINPLSLLELKTALDDTVREFFSLPRHNFRVSNSHQDIRLSLGWTSVFVALGTTWYAYQKDDFQATKLLVGAGVSLYVVLNTILVLYVAYFEKNTIWVGKRRTIASRITTEILEISSEAIATKGGYSTTSSWIPFPLSLLTSPSPSGTSNGTTETGQAAEGEDKYPVYSLTLDYTHSANANKSLLSRESVTVSKHVGELFDEEGRLGRDQVEEWLKSGFERVTRGNQS